MRRDSAAYHLFADLLILALAAATPPAGLLSSSDATGGNCRWGCGTGFAMRTVSLFFIMADCSRAPVCGQAGRAGLLLFCAPSRLRIPGWDGSALEAPT